MFRKVQDGKGHIRPLLVCYFVSIALDDKIRAEVSDDTAILNLTVPPGNQTYANLSSVNPPLPALLATWADKLGCEGFGPIVLLGFSEGCGGLRTQLLAGHTPTAIVAIDGIHSSDPPQEWQIDVWRKWFYKCGATLGPGGLGKPPEPSSPHHCRVTFSQIVPYGFRSVRKTIEQITAWGELEPGAVTDQDSPNYPGVPTEYRSGNVEVWSWPGVGKKAHIYQATAVLPTEVHFIASQLGFASLEPKPIDITKPITLKPGAPPKPDRPSVAARTAAALAPLALCGALTTWSAIR